MGEHEHHLRFYAVDVIGEPGLSAPSRPPFDSDAYALWLDDVMAGLDLTRVAMVGVSLGGWLALDYAMRRPEEVTRLALLSPGGVGRRVPDATVHLLPEVGHLLPDQSATLLDFLRDPHEPGPEG